MNKPVIIHISSDAKCKRCGKGWAIYYGWCMECIGDRIKSFDYILKPLKKKGEK